MNKIGITGGIGSGKTTVCRIFETLGYQVYYADTRAKMLMVENEKIIAGVKELFGPESYFPDGGLNRAHIGGIAFNNPEKLQQLNGLVHPATRQDFVDWYHDIPTDYSKSFVLKEAAILFESGSYKDSDGVIEVYAPKSVRLSRVMKRDNADEAAILARMDKQWSDTLKMYLADFTIFNDGEHSLIEQVMAGESFLRGFEVFLIAFTCHSLSQDGH